MSFESVTAMQQRRTDAALPVLGLTEPVSGALSDLAMRELRIRPRQARAVESVQRLLTVAGVTLFQRESSAGASLGWLANEAGLTPQAAYRYFAGAEELIRVGLRCIALAEYERMSSALSTRILPDEASLGRAIAGVVSDGCRRLNGLPAHVREDVLREYGHVGQVGACSIYGLLCDRADAADVRRALSRIAGAAAMAAVVAVAVSLFSHDGGPPQYVETERVLASLFVSVLRDGAR